MEIKKNKIQLNWFQDPEMYFREYEKSYGLKLVSRDIAIQICERAYQKKIWILGIDCGQIVDGSKYMENPDEGWVTKSSIMSPSQFKLYKKGLSSRFDLHNNNDSALLALIKIKDRYDAFVLTSKKMEIFNH